MICLVRRGVTLIEVVIAIVVFAVGGLGLAATSGAIVRQMSSNVQRSRAAALASSRDELIHASPCAASSGSNTSMGVVATWQVGAPSTRVLIYQAITRPDAKGLYTETFLSGAPCD